MSSIINQWSFNNIILMTPGRMFSQWLSIQFRLVCMMDNRLQDVTKFAYLTFGLVYTQACYTVPLIIVFFSTADNVTITGSGGPLPQAPLMDTFDEYTQDSWTYDGRYSNLFVISILSYLPAFNIARKKALYLLVKLSRICNFLI